MSCAFPRGSPGMPIRSTVAITITVIAMPPWSTWRIGHDRRIDYREGLRHCCITGRFETKAHQFQETSIDHFALIERRPTITDIVTNRRVRVAGLRKTNKVG